MTDYTALRAASETFRMLLKVNITDSPEPDLTGVPVDLRSPEQLQLDTVTTAVSLWLYQVAVQPAAARTAVPDNGDPPRPQNAAGARRPLAAGG
jgi:hypothetical protein